MATHATDFLSETANDRFKRRGRAWFWGGLMFATVAHFGLMRFFPELTAADFSFSVTEFEAIELPPEVDGEPPQTQVVVDEEFVRQRLAQVAQDTDLSRYIL